MKWYLKTLALAVALVFMAGTAWSQVDVEYAPEGKGDVLIFPFYAAFDGGWETKLTVVNTDRTNSTVAKVVVRSPKYSGELLDFLIYLSPADVWTGTLKYDANAGGPVLYSDDDSILADYDFEKKEGLWADEQPVSRSLLTPNAKQNLKGTDYAEMGYVYVINVATWHAGDRPVDKDDILAEYGPFDGAGSDQIDAGDFVDPKNVLAGWMDFHIAGYGVATLNATTLKDYKNLTKIVSQRETVLAPVDHDFDENPLDPSGGSSDTTLSEIELALGKQDIAMPYLNKADAFSAHMFNFPTKYTDLDSVSKWLGDKTQHNISVISDWPGFTEKQKVATYKSYLFDLQENTIAEETPIWSPAPPEAEDNEFPHELNIRFTDGFGEDFAEGWVNYEFVVPAKHSLASDSARDYAPTIPVSVDLTASGMSFKYGAWTQGTVEYPEPEPE